MALKSQIRRNFFALLNHAQEMQMASRIPQFPFRPIQTDFHAPIDRRHVWTTPHLLNMSSQASPNPPQDSPATTKTVKVVVTGRVQSVRYSDWAVETANELGLKGYVKNRGDGCTEVLCSGDADKVDQMQELCKIGPACAIITKYVVNPSVEDPGTSFVTRQ